MTRILVVEDNLNLVAGLRLNLRSEGFLVEHVRTGAEAVSHPDLGCIGLVVLDLMLPGAVDGYGVLRSLRDAGHQMPVLILSARDTEADKVRGFRAGADDYVTKPFGALELIARLHALLRRVPLDSPSLRRSREAEPIRIGPVELWPANRMVFKDGRAVMLRPREYDLLLLLMRGAGSVLSREDLLREVWGYRPGVYSRTLDTHVASLRRKLETSPSQPGHIETVHKVGYRVG